jgi:hypothetical protein
MKQTLPWIVAVVLGVLFIGSRSQLSSQSSPNPNGRFQIIGAEHDLGGNNNEHRVVFRIDTQTGETATYEGGVELINEGKKFARFGYWRKVDEKFFYHDPHKEAIEATEVP